MDLNAEKVQDDVTAGGRLFHVLSAVMGSARLLTVQRHVDGTENFQRDSIS